MRKYLRDLCAPKVKFPTSSYWFLTKQGSAEESMLPIHPFKYGWGIPNVRRRAYKSGASFNFLTIFEIWRHTNAYWQIVCEYAGGIRYVVASFQSSSECSVQHERLCSLESVALEQSTLVARKGMSFFSNDPSQATL